MEETARVSARAENRYRAFAARQATATVPSHNEVVVRDLNELEKDPGAVRPFGDIVFVPGNKGWWAQCPVTGFGFWYPTLREAVRSWRVAVFIDGGRLVGQPI
jgi:hypothetical protein